MALPIIGSLVEAGLKIVDKIIPDKQAALEAKIKLMQLEQAGEFKEIDAQLQMAQMQADTNKVEAASPNLFVSGWRPAIGWICGLIFLANYVGVPLLAWVSPVLDVPPPPRLEMGEVLPVLLGMLGLGGLRTAERIKGVSNGA